MSDGRQLGYNLLRRGDDWESDAGFLHYRPKPPLVQDLHAFDDLDQLADRGGGFFERRLLLRVELDLDDALDTAGADHHRHADIEVAHPVLALEQRRAR